MDFDEYEYLEKTVEETVEETDREPLSSKKSKGKDKDAGVDKNDKEHRRRGKDEENDSGDYENRKDKKSRGEDDRVGRRDRDGKERFEKDRHRNSRKGDREVDREKDRKRSSRYLDREKEMNKEKREKDGEGEIKEKDRSIPSRKHETDRDRERECEFDVRDNRRFKEKKEKVEPEHDPERDQRTVFAFQMPLKATEKDAYDFFSKAGKVRDVRIIMDRNSRRSKGVGYIEFYDAMSVPMAIALTGQLLLGQPVIVKPSEAEKNLVQSTTSIAGSAAGPHGAVDRKLYVGNLHFNMTELQLKQIFESFGQVEVVQLPSDPETGHCKGFGFIQFAKLEDAKNAEKLNGQLDIAGRIIKVSSVADHVGLHDSGGKAADFDDDDGVGLALNAQSRAMLMQKLDRSGTATSFAQSFSGMTSSQQTVAIEPILPSVAIEPIGKPSECLLLKNLFDPSTETAEDFDTEIKEEVEEECSKYGRVNHSYVEKNSSGYVYMRFDTMEEAAKAQAAMHKRWFACRLISAVFLQTYEYDAKFNRAA